MNAVKSVAVTVIMFLGLLSASAQDGKVTGRVIDDAGVSVQDVIVSMFSADSSNLGVTLTAEDGVFELLGTVMPCILHFDHISYESQRKECTTYDVGDIILKAAGNEIDKASVTAYKPIVKIEDAALRYDLQQLAANTTATNVYEAISKLPGVDEKDGSFQLAGAGEMTIIINGKPSRMSSEQLETLLSSMPVDRIRNADIMYSAPPQYNVRGAVINLILSRSMDNTYSGELRGDFSHRRTPFWGTGGSFAVTNPKWSADAVYRYVDEAKTQISDITSIHTVDGTTHTINQYEDMTGQSKGHIIRAAFDYTPEENRMLSIGYDGQIVPHSWDYSASDGSLVKSLNEDKEGRNTHILSLRYKSPVGLDMGADYTSYTANSSGRLENEFSNGNLSSFDVESGQKISRVNVYGDMKHSFGGKWALTYGMKGLWAQDTDHQHYSSVTGDVNILDTDSRVTEWNAELYAGAEFSLSRGSLSASLSGEYNNWNGKERFTLYPQANFFWMFNQDHIVQANFSSDKTYPPYWMLQNSISHVDGYTEVHGNALLRPMRDYSTQLVYILRQKYVFALFHSYIADFFAQNAYHPADRLALVYKHTNFNYLMQYGININIPFSFAKWHNSELTVTGMRLEEKSDYFFGLAFDKGVFLGVASLDNDFRICTKPDISLNVSGTYQTPAIQGLFDVESSWSLNAGMKFSFFDRKLNITAKADDIFESRVPVAHQNIGGQQLKLDTSAYTRKLSINLTYRFGGYTTKERKSVDTSRFGH